MLLRPTGPRSLRARSALAAVTFTLLLSCPARALPGPPALPEPSTDNTFYVFAIWDGIMRSTEPQVAAEMDRLVGQFGKGNRYHRVGFAFILPGLEQGRTICRVARQKDLTLGVILGVQTHSNGGLRKKLGADLRCFQWRMNGTNWEGFHNALATREDNARDARVATPSRYCTAVRDVLEADMRDRAKRVAALMKEFPGVITVINGPIEEELATAAGGLTTPDADGYLADYSPFAVAEFRDWLRHTGQYDADTGQHAGQGAPESIVGRYVTVKGKPRSPFYDDPDPAHANGTGRSFNESFGTRFTTWKLRYWDLDAFPEPITDVKFNPSPATGRGATEGGFDAPRTRDASLWWLAWSWDVNDRKGYPPGNPAHPAFGFRQVMVAHYVQDLFDVCIAEGLPKELMFPHQIPGEIVGEARCRSSASPAWTGYLPRSGNVGVTRFDRFDPKVATQYTALSPETRNWGIFEWHPLPNSKPQDPKLYDRATQDLNTYYNARCHYLFAGWWGDTGSFPLDGSNFAKAIKDFLASREDKPYLGYRMEKK